MGEEMKHKAKYVKPEAKDLGPVGSILGIGCRQGNSNYSGGCDNGNQNEDAGCFWGNQNIYDGCTKGMNNTTDICKAGGAPGTSGRGRSPVWP
jgi:hypothetical protein